MINRSVLIVRPKQLYLDWAAQLDDTGLVPRADDEKTIYLIPEYDTPAQARAMLKKIYATVFENELYDWCTDETTWPPRRDFQTFMKWFSVEFHSMIVDLCGYRLTDDGI